MATISLGAAAGAGVAGVVAKMAVVRAATGVSKRMGKSSRINEQVSLFAVQPSCCKGKSGSSARQDELATPQVKHFATAIIEHAGHGREEIDQQCLAQQERADSATIGGGAAPGGEGLRHSIALAFIMRSETSDGQLSFSPAGARVRNRSFHVASMATT